MSSNTVIETANHSASAPAQRVHGRERLREEELHHLTGIVIEALDETAHLVRKINNKAFGRCVDYDGSKGTKPLNLAEVEDRLYEAWQCALVATGYLNDAIARCCDRQQPPF